MPFFIKLAFRRIVRDRLFSLINISGLSIGIICVLIIGAWVRYELSYDRFHSNADRIFRLTLEVKNTDGHESHFARNWQSWVNQMPSFFPSIERMARFSPMGHTSLKYNNIKFYSDNAFQANPEMLEVFDIYLVSGKRETALNEPHSILLSESLFEKYFSSKPILGKILDLAGIYDVEFQGYQVTGIFKDLSKNSHFHPDMLVSMEDPETFQGWAYTYFLLQKNTGPDSILDHFKNFSRKYIPEDEQKTIIPHLQPIVDIHLYSTKDREIEKNGSIRSVVSFTLIAFIIYVLALINYVNLNLVLLSKRQKMYMISNILGTNHFMILKNLLMESILYNGMTLLIAMVVIGLIPFIFHDLIPVSIHTNTLVFTVILSVALIIFASLVNTGVQASILSIYFRQSECVSITRRFSLLSKNAGLKKSLVVFQFSISIILFISAIYIHQQKEFMYDRRLGVHEGPILVLDGLNWAQKEKYFEFKERLLEDPSVLSVTGIMEEPSGQTMDVMDFDMGGVPDEIKKRSLYVLPVDDNFIDFFSLELISGENFSPFDPSLYNEDYILNESAVRFLGFDTPEEVIGRDFKLNFTMDSIFFGGKIRGVVRDFNFSPLNQKIKPMVLFQKPIWYWVILVKIDENRMQQAIRHTRSVWDQVYPSFVFDYEFNDDQYQNTYAQEFSQASLGRIFTIISMLIATLGLFSLSSSLIDLRTREIGIRKVNGAYWLDILLLLNKNFISWVFMSIIIAFPITWYLLIKWKENYPYNPAPSWTIFCSVGVLVLFIALIAISSQTIRAARKNPTEALRYE